MDSIKNTLDQKVEPLGGKLALNLWLNSNLEGVQREMLLKVRNRVIPDNEFNKVIMWAPPNAQV